MQPRLVAWSFQAVFNYFPPLFLILHPWEWGTQRWSIPTLIQRRHSAGRKQRLLGKTRLLGKKKQHKKHREKKNSKEIKGSGDGWGLLGQNYGILGGGCKNENKAAIASWRRPGARGAGSRFLTEVFGAWGGVGWGRGGQFGAWVDFFGHGRSTSKWVPRGRLDLVVLAEVSGRVVLTGAGRHAQVLLQELAKPLLVVPLPRRFAHPDEAPVPLLHPSGRRPRAPRPPWEATAEPPGNVLVPRWESARRRPRASVFGVPPPEQLAYLQRARRLRRPHGPKNAGPGSPRPWGGSDGGGAHLPGGPRHGLAFALQDADLRGETRGWVWGQKARKGLGWKGA